MSDMRKKARPHPESDDHMLCPFCDAVCEVKPLPAVCLGCGAKISLNGDGPAIFDASQKADRQEVEKAARQTAGQGTTGLEGDRRRRPKRLGKKRRA